MKKMKKLFCLLLIAIMTLTNIFSGCDLLLGGNNSSSITSSSTAIVEDISVKTCPKTEYILGEKFEITGGVLDLIYDNGTKGALAFTDKDVTVTEPDMSTVGTKNVIVEYDGFTASYQITIAVQKYTVTFDLNYNGAPAATTQTTEVGGYISRPTDPIRSGYRFIGWFTDKGATTEVDFSEMTVTSDVTIYAAWIEEVSVTFDLNYTDAPAATTISVAAGTNVQETLAPATTREGYIFNGWHTNATTDSLYDFSTSVSSSLTLYAHWTEIQENETYYDVIFNYNCADYENKTVTVLEGEKVAKPQDPTMDGRKFLGWYTELEGGSAYNFDNSVAEGMTLYAHWEIENYIVHFKYVIEGNETLVRTRKVNPGKTVSAGALPNLDGYKFVNVWYTDKEYTQVFDFSTEVNADYTLYIKPLKANRFEAEYTYIDESKSGFGSSDNFNGLMLIFKDNGTASSSNGYWVSGLYYNTAFLEFIITAEKDINDAMLELRLSAEWANMYIAPTNQNFGGRDYYAFEVSSAPALIDETTGETQKDHKGYTLFDETKKKTVDYSPIAIEGAITFDQSMVDKRPFTDYLFTTSFSLTKGVNVVRLTVTNDHAAYDGTMKATAPMIDCITIYTDVTLTWNPITQNVADPSKINGGLN